MIRSPDPPTATPSPSLAVETSEPQPTGTNTPVPPAETPLSAPLVPALSTDPTNAAVFSDPAGSKPESSEPSTIPAVVTALGIGVVLVIAVILIYVLRRR